MCAVQQGVNGQRIPAFLRLPAAACSKSRGAKGASVLMTREEPAEWGRPARESAHQVIWNAVAVPSFQIAVAGVDVAAATAAPTTTQIPT